LYVHPFSLFDSRDIYWLHRVCADDDHAASWNCAQKDTQINVTN
jgi:hypothetical protein